MEPISSTDNPHVKLARSLHESKGRRQHRAFLVEGLRLVEAATEAAVPELVLHTADFGAGEPRAQALLDRLSQAGVTIRPVTDRVLPHVADTVTPQGIVAVMPIAEVSHTLRDGTALDLILDELSDPGNAGTLLRTAAATGVTHVYAAPGTVDLFAPKVVRAAAGAHFALSISTLDWQAINPAKPAYFADAGAATRHWDVDWTRPSTLIISNEARGASSAARRLATHTVSIPMTGPVESLNAGIAGSVILYEALRQRITAGERT